MRAILNVSPPVTVGVDFTNGECATCAVRGRHFRREVPNGQMYTDNIKTQPSGTTVLHLSNSTLSVCATLSAQQSV